MASPLQSATSRLAFNPSYAPTDCSGTCGIASGTVGACVNVTGTVQCAGCANF